MRWLNSKYVHLGLQALNKCLSWTAHCMQKHLTHRQRNSISNEVLNCRVMIHAFQAVPHRVFPQNAPTTKQDASGLRSTDGVGDGARIGVRCGGVADSIRGTARGGAGGPRKGAAASDATSIARGGGGGTCMGRGVKGEQKGWNSILKKFWLGSARRITCGVLGRGRA